jgi:23S rRNA (pseudouridine1915-N3)-methyltransferase
MRWHLFVIGKPRLEFARFGVEEYLPRIRAFAPIELHCVKASTSAGESRALIERSKGMFRIVLDERGEQATSRAWAKMLGDFEIRGTRDVALLIGGADGHADEVRALAGWVWSLSRLTLQHELALVVVLEQIYRAYSIKGGMPYHRE